MNKHTSIAVLLCAAVLAGCGTKTFQDINGPVASARVKFYNFGVNAPSVNFYANTTKMTAISSTSGAESNLGTAYGSVGSGGNYAAIAPGQYTLTGNITAVTDNGLAISSVAATITDGKSYSFYMSGFYNTVSKTVEGFVIEDPYPATIDWSQAYVRFVNAISNSNPMTLYAKNQATTTEVPVGAAVAYKAGGAFTALPAGVYDLSTRYTGVTTNAIARTGVSFVAGKVYTISSRGDITITSSTATNRPFLDNTANR
ncbi:MAG: DUF4397 domain-containing protein [Proteobacteria bacterium]|nr:DUF4397 domain-containing protein [Pseudomonadota bacterium]